MDVLIKSREKKKRRKWKGVKVSKLQTDRQTDSKEIADWKGKLGESKIENHHGEGKPERERYKAMWNAISIQGVQLSYYLKVLQEKTRVKLQ